MRQQFPYGKRAGFLLVQCTTKLTHKKGRQAVTEKRGLMKKFIVLIGIAVTLLGLRFFDNGLLNSGFNGTYTVYGKDGQETVFAEGNLPMFERFDAYATRLDVVGGEPEAMQILKNLNAQIKWRETFDGGLIVVYAYSPDIFRSKAVQSTKINVMLAYGGGAGMVAVGLPLLMGSY